MITRLRNEVFADFKLPEKFTDPVIVSRFLPDGSLKTIGHIYQNLNDEEGAVTYLSIDSQGGEITPPTTNYQEAEYGFEQYAKQLTKKSQMKEWVAKVIEFGGREEEIKKIRIGRNMKNIQITK